MTVIDLACNDEKAFALSSLLHVPLIKVDAIVEDTEHELIVSVRPSYRTVNKALFDVMKFYAFKNVAVLYDGKWLAKEHPTRANQLPAVFRVKAVNKNLFPMLTTASFTHKIP